MCGEGFFSSSCLRQPPKVILKHGQELEEEQEELAEHQPLEQEDLNFERWKRRPLPKRTLHQKIDDLKTYLWNAETNEFMGRSGKSWSELTERRRVLCGAGVGGGGGVFEFSQMYLCVARPIFVESILNRNALGDNAEGQGASAVQRLRSLCCECVSLCSVFT